jgi:hypothetical protein
MMIVKIRFKNKKVYHGSREVVPPATIFNMLMSRGEKSTSYIQANNLKYVKKNNK